MIEVKKEVSFLACFLIVVLFLVASCNHKRSEESVDRAKTNNKESIAEEGITQQMKSAFGTAESLHTSILLPNSMARTNDVNKLIPKWKKEFQESIKIFIKNSKRAAVFLDEKLSKIRADDDQYPGLCALRILCEINSPESLQIIKKHSNHPNKIIAEFARTPLSVEDIEK